MKQLFCDICKKEVVDPVPGRTFFHIREFDLCEPCRDDLDAAVKMTVRTKKPFDFAWYEKLRYDLLQTGAKSNRIPVSKQSR
ncbi:MAG TPA: hypothetical protein DCG47_12000 [Spirochaetaceae bacterium]|jgi:hypothetical protein|nr:hypothetical protein [Spirochaetaceae bacterium]